MKALALRLVAVSGRRVSRPAPVRVRRARKGRFRASGMRARDARIGELEHELAEARRTADEAGADYVLFGEPDARGQRPSIEAIAERLQWWAELFEPPCVGYAAS